MALPLIGAAGGVVSKLLGSATLGTAIKAVAMSFAVLGIVKALLVVVVGLLSYSLVPVLLNNLPSIDLPGAQSWTPGLIWAADLFALDQVTAILFSALNVRFVIRRLS